ncbi:uncharacterized protein LOC115666323 [Syzygium oleosum]|uniref:uncharacterized protein LOC115666323 n=1 Tax=Syzygium oleosum TaxID=219896 RepID=UPI0024B990F1|nr:uncharacterized protein LOC115666323 [Syzygium oleosum]
MSSQGRGGGRGLEQGRAEPQVKVAEDPWVDGILRALEEAGIRMDRQTQERNATVAATVEAAVAATSGANGNNRNQGNNGNPTPGPANVIRPISKLVEQFLKLKPPKFNGKGDPEAAPRWVEELEKAFEVLGCTETERVTLAIYQLQDNANGWWKATKGRSAQKRKLAEFMRLRQGSMTVDQYEAEFARLSKFAPRMVENPQDKVRRFRDKLKPDLRSHMISLNIRDYGEMYERAQAIERDQLERAATSGSRFAQNRGNRRFGKKPMAGNRRFVPPIRKNIGKPNHQQNRFGACFKCGSLEHQIRNCPQQRPAGPPMQPQQPRVGNQAGNPPPANLNRPPA